MLTYMLSRQTASLQLIEGNILHGEVSKLVIISYKKYYSYQNTKFKITN